MEYAPHTRCHCVVPYIAHMVAFRAQESISIDDSQINHTNLLVHFQQYVFTHCSSECNVSITLSTCIYGHFLLQYFTNPLNMLNQECYVKNWNIYIFTVCNDRMCFSYRICTVIVEHGHSCDFYTFYSSTWNSCMCEVEKLSASSFYRFWKWIYSKSLHRVQWYTTQGYNVFNLTGLNRQNLLTCLKIWKIVY